MKWAFSVEFDLVVAGSSGLFLSQNLIIDSTSEQKGTSAFFLLISVIFVELAWNVNVYQLVKARQESSHSKYRQSKIV